MARYRFIHECHEIEVVLNVGVGEWLLDGDKIDESKIDPSSTGHSGSFVVETDGHERKYEWNVQDNIHRLTCNGDLVFEVELYEWFDG